MKTKAITQTGTPPGVSFINKYSKRRSFTIRPAKKHILFLLILFSVTALKVNAQIGTLTGWGMSTCAKYSFNICPAQIITPQDTGRQKWKCNPVTAPAIQDISFTVMGNLWRVAMHNFTFTTNVPGQISGVDPGGSPVGPFPIAAPGVVNAAGVTVIGGLNYINFNINGIPIGTPLLASNFSITINSVAFGANSFTLCTNTNTSVVISPTVPTIGSPWTYTWQPGLQNTPSITVSPAVTTIYTLTTLPAGTDPKFCLSTVNVTVVVKDCTPPVCCIGNSCISTYSSGTNPLASNWQVPLNNFNYVFNGLGGTNNRVGIGTNCSPNNKLEITSDPFVPYGSVIGTNGASGLRLTNLTSLKIPMPNPGPGVLSVDAAGDVIYVRNPGGSLLGNLCSGTSNPISGAYEIPLAGNGFNFTTPSNSTGQIIMGLPNCSSPLARLNVFDDNFGTGIYGFSSNTSSFSNNIGVHGAATFGGGNVATIGTMGEVTNPNTAARSAGVAGFAGPAVTTGVPFGSFGVYGSDSNIPGLWAGWFSGDMMITGSGWVNGGILITSDKRFKKNIDQIENASEKIAKLKGYTYTFRTDEFKEKHLLEGNQIGFIAQELKEVFPELVKEGSDGYMAVNYVGMIPVLLEGFKEQKTLVEKQQKQIDELKNMIQSLASNTAENKLKNTQAVSLSDKNAIVLDQNVPNPFAESTVINYNIPTEFSKAQIIFSTNDGRIIRSVDINSKGEGHLTVFANDLSNGMYSYTLVVDGKTIATKKMIKQ